MSIIPDPTTPPAQPRPCDLLGCVAEQHPAEVHECAVDVHAAPIVNPGPGRDPQLMFTAVRDAWGDWVDLDLGAGPAVRISLAELLDGTAAAAAAGLRGVR